VPNDPPDPERPDALDPSTLSAPGLCGSRYGVGTDADLTQPGHSKPCRD
jgi:hypothetical protein